MVRKWVLGAACVGALYGLWQVFQSPQVDAVHLSYGRPHFVLVRHFPLTQQGKIDWWDRNQAIFMAKYKVSSVDVDLAFMAWDGTYRIDRGTDEDSDLLCFEDMDTQANCIEKNFLMHVARRTSGGMRFTVRGSTGRATYVRDPGSDVLRRRIY